MIRKVKYNLLQVTRALEDLIAMSALLVDVHWRGILLATSHGALDVFVGGLIEADGTLGRDKNLRLAADIPPTC
jgi:hypothetical protein